jgi:hypothetical protein
MCAFLVTSHSPYRPHYRVTRKISYPHLASEVVPLCLYEQRIRIFRACFVMSAIKGMLMRYCRRIGDCGLYCKLCSAGAGTAPTAYHQGFKNATTKKPP